MREVKFRGLTTLSKEWVYGDLIQRTHEFIFPAGVYTTKIYDCLIEIYPETKGQYTGLKDKNGVEIYEGDILGRIRKGEVKNKGLIKFGHYEENADGGVLHQTGFYLNDSDEDLRGDILFFIKYMDHEVIGNIYENPEMMEVNTNE